MKKICVSLLIVAMLVCVLAPGVSALDRDWRMVVKQKAEKPEGDETGWNVDAAVVEPNPILPDERNIEPSQTSWIQMILRFLATRSFTSPKESGSHDTAQ